ncbi:MAG: toprim domain-containing protein [Litorimonas sp.]
MRRDILEEARKRLVADFKFKVKGQWLQGGTCPSCAKRELFTHADSPWVVKCGRLNNCGEERHIRDIYPELFERFNERYTATVENPNATADAYMSFARGFDVTQIRGWYRQEKFWHSRADRGTATVRFDIDRTADIYMERFVEPVTITDPDGTKTVRKQNFHGSHGGLWWQPPTLNIEDKDTIWLVEGCLDAVALNLNGIKAVAILSAGNYPEKALAKHSGRSVRFVFALDSDAAGRRFTRKHVKRARKAGFTVDAAQISRDRKDHKRDWNDLHMEGRLTESRVADYRHYGDLLVAETAWDKAMLIWGYERKSRFCFNFANRLYWFTDNIEKLVQTMEELRKADDALTDEELRSKAIKEAGSLSQICNCFPDFLYYQFHAGTGESWYYCRVSFPNGRPSIKTTFTGAQIASSGDFKKRLLSATPGGLYMGGGAQLNWIVENDLDDIKQVETIDFVGYSREHKAYIFPDFAIRGGKHIPANAEDYIEIDKASVKTLSSSFAFEIGRRHQYEPDWPQLVYQAFGMKGLAALTYWFGSLFAEQIRSQQKSFPFLEIVGEAGSGKTTLVEFLWKTLGLEDTEGFDPSKSTFAAIRRKFAQVSNLPIVLLEGDHGEDSKHKKFDFTQLKDTYNGRPFGERGIKNGGNETYAPPFRGAIVIAQNDTVQSTDAVLTRIVHLDFDMSGHSARTREAADRLNQLPVKAVSNFLLQAISREADVLEYLADHTRRIEDDLLTHPKIKTFRIAKNHAQLTALGDCLTRLCGFDESVREDLRDFFEQLAVERETAVKADHPKLQAFWEMFDYLDAYGAHSALNHSRDPQLIAVNLNHFVRIATEQRQQVPVISEIKERLKKTRTHKFVGVKAVNSAIATNEQGAGKTVKCWVFERKVRRT